MKSYTRSLPIVLLVIAAACVFYSYRLDAGAEAAAQQPTACTIALSSAVPHDATIPKSHIGNPTAIQVDFDSLSWNTFIALNWPADPGYRGKPDTSKKIGADDYSPVVWETYKESYEVFMADGQGNPVRPTAWNSAPQPPPGCDQNSAYAAKLKRPVRVVQNISKDGLNEYTQAFVMAPLTDQNGAFARYEVLTNQDEFEQILNPADPITGLMAPPLYDSRNQTNVNFHVGQIGGPEGPIEVKAAWKILGPYDNPNRYHTELIQIAWPVSTNPATPYKCSQPILVGLVALHIAHKTKNAPQWVWSTFEQMDNYKPPPGSPLGRKAAFYNPECRRSLCPVNQLPTPPAGGWNGDPSVLNQAPPTQVVPTDSATVKTTCNDVAHQLLLSVNPNTVWQYYRLVFTQWPQDPNCGGKPCPVYQVPSLAKQGANQLPVFMANAAIETYFMGTSAKMDTCMFCHSVATGLKTQQTLDFSYLLQEAYPIDSSSIAALRAQRMQMAPNRKLPLPRKRPTGRRG
jgi:hypothetical protein